MRVPDALVLVAVLLLGVGIVSGRPHNVEAAGRVADISSAGPLDHVYVDAQLACQFSRVGDPDLAFFDPRAVPGDCGTFVVVDGILFAPDLRGGGVGSIGPFRAFTSLSQTAVVGAGTPADPYRVTTTVAAGSSDIRIIQTDSYVVGEDSYRTDITVANVGDVARTVRLYHAADCYAAGSDLGYGFADPATGSVACAKNPNNRPSARVEQFVPLTPADHFYEDYFDHVWARIGAHATLPNTCRCESLFDNAIAVGWDRSIPARTGATFSLLTAVAIEAPAAAPPTPAPAPTAPPPSAGAPMPPETPLPSGETPPPSDTPTPGPPADDGTSDGHDDDDDDDDAHHDDDGGHDDENGEDGPGHR